MIHHLTRYDTIKVGAEANAKVMICSRSRVVLHQCGLLPDLALFEAGDQTEVGEKGLTLRYVCVNA